MTERHKVINLKWERLKHKIRIAAKELKKCIEKYVYRRFILNKKANYKTKRIKQ